MKTFRPLIIALTLLTSQFTAIAQSTPDAKQWFREARFGLFIHWGVYAVPAGEWQGKPVNGIGEWIMKNGKIPVADYRTLAKDFTAANYKPQDWAALAKKAGVKYVVITAKHHDGFALYDSKASDWNAVKASAAGRDLIAPLAEAVRAEGLHFGTYYSQSQDWTNPGGERIKQDPPWDAAQKGDYDTYLRTIALPQVHELLTNYHPDVIWWDTPVAMTPERVKPFADLLHELSPNIISNNRLGTGFSGDTKTPEQHIPPRGYPGEMFEVCMTMNDTWGFKKNDHNWKSVRQLLCNLSDISSKGGNFLLNVGPTAEGEIPPESVERLQAIGRWMKTNSEAIYATEAGPFPRRLPWGRTTQKQSPDGAATLYLHIWDWPADGRILLPTLTELPTTALLLANGAGVTSEKTPDGVVVTLPGAAPDPDISVVRLTFAAKPIITQLGYNLPGPDGSIEINAVDADPNGGLGGNFTLQGKGKDSFLTHWKAPDWSLDYQIRVPVAGSWKVTAEIAATESIKLTLSVLKTESAATLAAAANKEWRTVELGTIDLPAGESTLKIKGVKDGWQRGPDVRKLKLTPIH